MPCADQVPVKSPHFEMHWHMWVVLIAGSAGSALRAVCPPNFTSGRMSARSRSRRECDGFLVALTPGHHGPRHPCDLVGQRDRRDLGRPARQQCREPGPVLSAMDFGIADHRQRASGEQATQIAIACFGTSPIHAEKSRPDRKAFGSATLATKAVASAGPTPGISFSRLLVALDR